MEELKKQVRRAQRRMGLQRFVGVLGWCWFATLLLALGLIVADRFYPLGTAAWGWAAEACGAGDWLETQMAAAARGEATGPLGMSVSRWLGLLYACGVVAVALGLGVVVAAVWIVATRREPLGAAIEIDRRFALKERVSSTLAMPPGDRQTGAGQALLADAVRRVERIEVAERFAVAPPKQFLLPLVPAVLAVLVAVLFSPAAIGKQDVPDPGVAAVNKQVKKASDVLRRKLAERRKQAEKMGLKDAEEFIKKLEEGSKDLIGDKTERKKALAKLNDLAQEIQQRRKQLGGTDEIRRQLNQLKNVDREPAGKFAKAIGRRDFEQAAAELEKLKEQLANSELDEQQKQELAKQLEQIKQKLNELAEAHQAAQGDLQQRIDQLRQMGQLAEAGKLQEQLDKLLDELPQIQQLEDLADKLGQCSKCLREGQLEDALEALKDLQAGLGDLQGQLDELAMLDDLMEQLAKARDQMNCCPLCGGVGCQACQGDQPGMGMGPGQGQGPRPEADDETDSYDSWVRQKAGAGTGVITDLIHGPNAKGNVTQEIKQQFDTARGSTDPLTGRRIPREHRQHTREYFDSFREGN